MKKEIKDKQRMARRLVEILRGGGFEAYFVGGCVRDKLLGRKPEEYDIATSATPDEVIRTFRKTRKIGVKFGVVLVGLGGFWFEVATFRKDIGYSDGRHPDKIEPGTIEEDAQRRDFTINGMYLDPFTNEIIDFVGGLADIESRVIRAIGEPEERFSEDHLRMLRAVRFYAQLLDYGFKVDEKTVEAIKSQADKISQISTERILEELKKMFEASGRAEGLKLANEVGLIDVIFPEIKELKSKSPNVFEEAIQIIKCMEGAVSFEVVLAVLLANIGLLVSDKVISRNPIRARLPAGSLSNPSAQLARKIVKRLKCSNEQIRKVVWLVEYLPRILEPERLTLAEVKWMIIGGFWDDVRRILAGMVSSNLISKDKLDKLEDIAKGIDKNSLPPSPLISGDDLKKKFSLPPGPKYKKILDEVYEAQLNEEISSYSQAIEFVSKLL